MQNINEKLTKFTLKYRNGKENVQLMHINVKQNMSQKWSKMQEKNIFQCIKYVYDAIHNFMNILKMLKKTYSKSKAKIHEKWLNLNKIPHLNSLKLHKH